MNTCLMSHCPFPPLPTLWCRNQSMLFGGSPRYENVPLIGRGSPPPSVRWPYDALVSLVWWPQHWQQTHSATNTATHPHCVKPHTFNRQWGEDAALQVMEDCPLLAPCWSARLVIPALDCLRFLSPIMAKTNASTELKPDSRRHW